ncbi:serine hydrolase domain-containing protein [Pseudorhodoferax sp.]|uniref:serine hydrolase domain-containing protein n=1 Tax=Pseudorhodoferax sp. TaxID=1993553 RepID=UPI002DD6A366|nr:serine hydrolase [Pseudorhodoferax sp.]
MPPAIPLPPNSRRRVLQAAAALACAPAMAAADPSADPFSWPRSEPAAAGIAPELGSQLDEGVRSGKFPDLHAVVVVRRGAVVLERYYTGPDERWGTPLGRVAFDARTRHDLRSVSKSIVGLLYGIALAEGKVPALDQPVLDAFPADADLAAEPDRRAITIAHVLAMTMGLEWNEDLPYTDPRNSEIAMERSPDRYRYVLSRPIVGAPGAAWRYSGGATALLGHLVARGTGMPLLDYARARLFAPLGIEDVEWTPGLDGEAAAASGLRMRAPDLARVGQLLLDQGRWQGRSVVPADWLAASQTPRITAFEGVQYGYHWYLARRPDGSAFGTLAFGLGGQRLVVVPALELVYVVFMGNYNRRDQLGPVFAVQGLVHGAVR